MGNAVIILILLVIVFFCGKSVISGLKAEITGKGCSCCSGGCAGCSGCAGVSSTAPARPKRGKTAVKTTVNIDGMMCSMCEAHINEAIRKAFPNISKVKSSHRKNTAMIFSNEPLDEAKLKAAIEETGYEFKGIMTDNR